MVAVVDAAQTTGWPLVDPPSGARFMQHATNAATIRAAPSASTKALAVLPEADQLTALAFHLVSNAGACPPNAPGRTNPPWHANATQR